MRQCLLDFSLLSLPAFTDSDNRVDLQRGLWGEAVWTVHKPDPQPGDRQSFILLLVPEGTVSSCLHGTGNRRQQRRGGESQVRWQAEGCVCF